MKLLLDTHVLLWWLDDPKQLSRAAQSAIRDEHNEVLVSAVVVWEIVIKKSLDKLDAPDNIDAVIQANRFDALPIGFEHAMAIRNLPLHHRDPFDRMLIAQARVEGMTLVNRDPDIAKYAVAQLLA